MDSWLCCLTGCRRYSDGLSESKWEIKSYLKVIVRFRRLTLWPRTNTFVTYFSLKWVVYVTKTLVFTLSVMLLDQAKNIKNIFFQWIIYSHGTKFKRNKGYTIIRLHPSASAAKSFWRNLVLQFLFLSIKDRDL